MVARDGRRYGDVLGDVLIAGFLPVRPVPRLARLVLLRQDQGEYWVLGMLIAVVAADTGAYASGLAFGSHPMAPRISPKKTWEGFAGEPWRPHRLRALGTVRPAHRGGPAWSSASSSWAARRSATSASR
jgi:hypothetical protein